MKRIIFITGGARSGKSTYAEKMALSLSPNPVYLATARIWTKNSANESSATNKDADRNGQT